MTGLRGRVSYLDGDEHGMCLANYTNDYGTLLHGLGGVFDLEYSSLRRAGSHQYTCWHAA